MAVGYYSKNYYIFLCEFFVQLFLASEFLKKKKKKKKLKKIKKLKIKKLKNDLKK